MENPHGFCPEHRDRTGEECPECEIRALRARLQEFTTLTASAVSQLMYGTNGKEEALKLLRTAIHR